MEFTPIKPSSFYGRRFQNLASALDFMENSPNPTTFDIALIPPDPDCNTDEEEGDVEDILGKCKVHYAIVPARVQAQKHIE